jgi:NAD(P)-dependent dehydrogenase (short-subunit alcohol dehydrogenase family)
VPVAVLEAETLGSFASIERRVRELTAEHGPVQGLAHLAALSPNGRLTSLDEWRRHTQSEVKSLFELLRLTARDLEGRAADGGACVLGASLLGGAWGRQGEAGAGAPAAGGIYGLLKTLHTEHPEVHARVVDFDGSLASDEMADIVLREMLTSSGEFEVGYPGGRRTVFTARAEPIEVAGSPPDLLPEPGWVVLVTGGAQGVTAGLARRIAAPGVRMVVVGRSAPPAEEDQSFADLADAAALRRHFLDQARAAGAAPTPAQVEQRVQEVLKARAMRDNLAALAAAGAEVEYVAADASRPEGLGAVIEGIYARHGRLDAVLHGVGVIEDRLLRDKTRESFERVFDTKADSTVLLSRALRPQGLRWVVLMSSISGRIGNRGQIDYAAANEVMNRLAWEMARHFPDTRVLSINWGPWSGPGMTSPEVLRRLAARGLGAIEPEAGWRFLRDELTAGSHRVVEVIAGSGL